MRVRESSSPGGAAIGGLPGSAFTCGLGISYPIGTVLAIGTRGPRLSAKKSMGDCARTFCCRTMSGKISHGVRPLFSPRKPQIATRTMLARKKMRRKPRNISILVVHHRDVQPPGFRKQIVRFHFTETRIERLDRQEKSVIRCAAQSAPVENRTMPA